jgi:plasmid maintenance system killer protein
VDIVFRTRKLEKLLNSRREMDREFPPARVRKLMNRLRELRDMPNLGAMESLPYVRCHALKHDREGQWSLDLDLPWVLLIEPFDEPMPTRDDGAIDVDRVTTVRVLEITRDTHDRGHH